MPDDLDLNLLRLALAIHATTSVSGAAIKLGVSQPAASLALGRLRQAVGDDVFVRTGHGMIPTPRGADIVAAARQIFDLVDGSIMQRQKFDPETEARTFRIALSDVGEMVFLPRISARILSLAPKCSVLSMNLATRDLDDALLSTTADIALGYFPDLEKPGYFVQSLFDHRFVGFTRRDHPLLERGAMTLESFLGARHVAVNLPSRSQELLDNILKAQNLRRQVQLTVSHFLSVPPILEETDLIAVVPEAIAAYFRPLGTLATFEPPVDLGNYQLKQHWHERFTNDAGNRWLRTNIAAAFGGRLSA